MANNINFPSKIRIESPELDAVKESSQTILKILTKYLEQIVAPLQTLTVLPELIKGLRDTLVENFENLFTSNVESEVLARQADIKVIENKTGFVKDHINKKKQHTKELIEVIKKDYMDYFDEIANEHALFSRKLDNHAYEIVDQIYPKQIQEKFSFQSLPCINFLSEHISNSAFSRSFCFNEYVKIADTEIDKFIEERDILYSEISQYGGIDLSNGFYKIPFEFIEIENVETNEIEIKVVYPWCENDISSEISDDALSILKELATNKINTKKKYQKNTDEVEILCKALTENHKISDEELERFRNDCSTLILED